ncbi:MAG: hypothetical protein L6R48_23095, partial [Planctomycetes bacterium]|nr:hypothetical protein [Planctomycetota bacterium]
MAPLRELAGLEHGPQVVEVAAPPGGGRCLALADGRWRAALQRSRRDPARGFLYLPDGLPAHAERDWRVVAGDGEGPLRCRLVAGGWELDNGLLALRLVADGSAGGGDGLHPGPVAGVRGGDGSWHLRTWLDTRASTCRWRCVLEEDGPLRAVWRGRAELGGGRWYELEVTLDAGLPFARLAERGGGGRGDQVVWDFAGPDLPVRWLQTDAGPGHAAWRPHYGIDRRLARLAGWTQFSQLSDLADGFAAVLDDGTALGAVALAGGGWRGGRLNHLEAWVRRFAAGHPEARRGEPPEARADLLHPDAIAARGASGEAPHLCWEGWIGPGTARCWALAAAPAAALEPPGGA